MSRSLNDETATEMKADEEDTMDITERLSVEKEDTESSTGSDDVVKENVQDDDEINEDNNEEELAEEVAKITNCVDYGTILSFFDKFSKHLALRDMNVFKNFELSVIAKNALGKKFIEFHINLLKNLSTCRHIKRDKWEAYLCKYVSKYSKEEGLEIETNGYVNTSPHSRLAIIKNLLESQFDENSRVKQAVAERNGLEALRAVPLGWDITGEEYWYFIDPECSVRLFTFGKDSEDSWRLIASKIEQIKEVIDRLAADPKVIKLRNSEQYRERVLREEEEEEARRLEEEEARRVEEEKEKLKEEEEEAKSETSEPKLENSDLFDTEVESTQENVKSEKLPVEAEATKVKEEMNESTPPVELEKEATTAGIVLEKKKKPAYKGRLKRDVSSDDESEIGISDISDSDDENIPLSYLRKRLLKKFAAANKKRLARKKLATKHNGPECSTCLKSKPKQTTLLCDSCDLAFHLPCVLPKLSEVPEGLWYCSTCNQDKLIISLQHKVHECNEAIQKLEADRLLQLSKPKIFEKELTPVKHDTLDSDETSDLTFKNNFFDSAEPVGPRRCRNKKNISYTFDEYDRNINSAMGIPDKKQNNTLSADYSDRPKRNTRSSGFIVPSDNDSDSNNSSDDSKSSADSEFKVKATSRSRRNNSDDSFSDPAPRKAPRNKPARKKKRSESYDSDESFTVTPRKVKKPSNARKSNRRAPKRKNYDSDETVTEEDSPSEEASSDEDEKIARYNQLFANEERRSTRTRKCITETYADSESSDEGTKKKKNKRKQSDSDETFSDSEEELKVKRKFEERPKRGNRSRKVYDEDEEEMSNDEKCLDVDHRAGSEEKRSRDRTIIKAPDTDDGTASEQEDEEGEETDDSKEEEGHDEVIVKKTIEAPAVKERTKLVDEKLNEKLKAVTAAVVVKKLDESISEYSSESEASEASDSESKESMKTNEEKKLPASVTTTVNTEKAKPESTQKKEKTVKQVPEDSKPQPIKSQPLQTFNLPPHQPQQAQQPQIPFTQGQHFPPQPPPQFFTPHQQPNNFFYPHHSTNPQNFNQQHLYYQQLQYQQQAQFNSAVHQTQPGAIPTVPHPIPSQAMLHPMPIPYQMPYPSPMMFPNQSSVVHMTNPHPQTAPANPSFLNPNQAPPGLFQPHLVGFNAGQQTN